METEFHKPLVRDLPVSFHKRIGLALDRDIVARAFSSGAGLRVVRLENRAKKLVGYGEHPYIEHALRYAAEDYARQRRKPTVERPYYLTGSTSCVSHLDLWVRRGSQFAVSKVGDEIEARLYGYGEVHISDKDRDRVFAGETVEWEARGYSFRSYPDSGGCVTQTLSGPASDPKFHLAHHFRTKRVGRGHSFITAMLDALIAEDVEVPNGTYEKENF